MCVCVCVCVCVLVVYSVLSIAEAPCWERLLSGDLPAPCIAPLARELYWLIAARVHYLLCGCVD